MYAINYLAILLAGIAAMAIGFAWYSPALFGKMWMKEMGMDNMTPEQMAEGKKKMYQSASIGLLAQLVVAATLSYLAQATLVLDAAGAIQLAICVWLGFGATTAIHAVLWEKKSWTAYFINVGYLLVSFVVIALIVVLWV